jgi:uncharacterized protein YqiB (DUF1249 family)
MSLLNPVNKSLCLEQLCAANFEKLRRLLPDLATLEDMAEGIAARNAPLYLKTIERTPYTLTVELSHCFNKNKETFVVPAVVIRMYLDAQLAEVISDHARGSVAQVFDDPSLSRDIMDYKWRLNYFLQKWLDHCLQQHYLFTVKATNKTVAS